MTPEQLMKGRVLTIEIEVAQNLLKMKDKSDEDFMSRLNVFQSHAGVGNSRQWLKDRIRLARLQLQKDIEADLKDMQKRLEAL